MAYDISQRSKGPLGRDLPPAVAFIDGNMMAKQAYHTTGDLITEADGTNVGVLFGFVKMLGTLIWNFPSVEQIYVLWDSYPTWRALEFPYYKASRGTRLPSLDPGNQDTWEVQKTLLREILPLMGIHGVRASNMEADDLAYLLPRSALFKEKLSILVSSDRDWLQLVDERNYVFRTSRKDLVTPENFSEVTKYGRADLVVQLKALIGDGDEFPGCHGIGEKIGLAYLTGEAVSDGRVRKIRDWMSTQQYQDNLTLGSIPACESRQIGDLDVQLGTFDAKTLLSRFRDLEFYSVTERWQDFCDRYSALTRPE